MQLIAAIIEGKADFADVMFLVALIVFGVLAVTAFMSAARDFGLLAVGLASMALAWLVL